MELNKKKYIIHLITASLMILLFSCAPPDGRDELGYQQLISLTNSLAKPVSNNFFLPIGEYKSELHIFSGSLIIGCSRTSMTPENRCNSLLYSPIGRKKLFETGLTNECAREVSCLYLSSSRSSGGAQEKRHNVVIRNKLFIQ